MQCSLWAAQTADLRWSIRCHTWCRGCCRSQLPSTQWSRELLAHLHSRSQAELCTALLWLAQATTVGRCREGSLGQVSPGVVHRAATVQQQVQHVSVVTRPTRGVRRTAMDHHTMCPSDTCLAFQLPASARGPSVVYLSQSSRVVTCKWVALMPSPSAHLAWMCVQSIGAIGHSKASIPTLYCYQLLACVDNTSPASRNVA